MCPGCVGKNNSLVQFEDGHNREMIYISLSCICSKQDVYLYMSDPISYLPKKRTRWIFDY